MPEIRTAALAELALAVWITFRGARLGAPWSALYPWQPGYLPWAGAFAAPSTLAVRRSAAPRGAPPRARCLRRRLDATYRAHVDPGLAIVGVDVGEATYVARRFLESTPVSYPIWLDAQRGESADRTEELLQRVGGVGLPTTVFIDRRDIVRKIRVGELSRAVMEDEVQRLLSR